MCPKVDLGCLAIMKDIFGGLENLLLFDNFMFSALTGFVQKYGSLEKVWNFGISISDWKKYGKMGLFFYFGKKFGKSMDFVFLWLK